MDPRSRESGSTAWFPSLHAMLLLEPDSVHSIPALCNPLSVLSDLSSEKESSQCGISHFYSEGHPCQVTHADQVEIFWENVKTVLQREREKSDVGSCWTGHSQTFWACLVSEYESMKVLVAQLCPTLCNPMHCSPARLLCPWDSPGKNNGVSCHALLQGIFPTQGSKPGLPHCRQMLYPLSR